MQGVSETIEAVQPFLTAEINHFLAIILAGMVVVFAVSLIVFARSQWQQNRQVNSLLNLYSRQQAHYQSIDSHLDRVASNQDASLTAQQKIAETLIAATTALQELRRTFDTRASLVEDTLDTVAGQSETILNSITTLNNIPQRVADLMMPTLRELVSDVRKLAAEAKALQQGTITTEGFDAGIASLRDAIAHLETLVTTSIELALKPEEKPNETETALSPAAGNHADPAAAVPGGSPADLRPGGNGTGEYPAGTDGDH